MDSRIHQLRQRAANPAVSPALRAAATKEADRLQRELSRLPGGGVYGHGYVSSH